MRPVSPAEALVVVTFDSWPVPVRLLLDLLEFIGSWADVGELEMDGPRMLRFRVPREQMLTVILALDCHGVTDVKAYEIYPGSDICPPRPRFQNSASDRWRGCRTGPLARHLSCGWNPGSHIGVGCEVDQQAPSPARAPEDMARHRSSP